jgi:hypothetical protein
MTQNEPVRTRIFTTAAEIRQQNKRINERLDQGHLHPLLEQAETDISRPGIEQGPPRWEASTLAKSYSNSQLTAIRIIYNSSRQY